MFFEFTILNISDVYLVGGLSGTSATNQVTLFDDIWKFSLLEGTWTKFSTTLTVPLYFHSADICEVLKHSFCLFVFCPHPFDKISHFFG